MGAFFALLGAVVGYYLGYQWKPNTLIPSILFGLLFVCISFRKKKLWFYLVPLLMAFLIRLIPWAGKEGIKEVEGIVVYARNNYFIIQSGWARYYVYEKGSLREVGDYLHCYGLSQEFLNTTYEGHFDFGQYLYQKGVLYTFRARSIDAPFQMPVRFREMERKFLSFFSSGTQGLLDAILFNHKDLNNESVALASSLGLLGVLSSSGLLYGSALRIIRKLLSLKLSEKVASVLVLAVAAFLLPFAIGKIGIWRVFLVQLLRVGNLFLFPKRKCPSFVLTSAAGLLIVALDYRLCYETGFLLGFGASYFFVFSSFIKKKGVAGKLSSLLLLFFFLLPASISMGDLHPFFLLFSTLLLPLSLGFAFLGFLSFLRVPLVAVLNGYSSFLVSLLHGLGHFDLAVSLPAPSEIAIALYYLFLLFVCYLRDAGFKKLRSILGVFAFGIYSLSFVPVVPSLTSSVTFINVGQGDSILIQDGLHAVMIDTGGVQDFDMAEEVLIPYLKKRRIYHLDALIGTHGDFDHVGAAASLLEHFPVSSFIEDSAPFPLEIGRMKLENLNDFATEAKGENDTSLVISLSLIGKKWLFMGDASLAVEKKIIEKYPNLDCDILKVGHHGSNTATSALFLDRVTPEEAIISCGENNEYGHPHKSVLEALKKRGIRIRRTDQEGTIVYQNIRLPAL